MWICPKCGREFQRRNQGHYCGKAPETVLEYIASQPLEAQPHMTALRQILQTAVPGVREQIRWSMPHYEQEGRSISFAACKRHLSFYVGAEAVAAFAPQLHEFATKKHAVYLPYHKELPTEILTAVVRWRFG